MQQAQDQSPKFSLSEEQEIKEIRESAEKQAKYALRRVLSICERLAQKVQTDRRDEFGELIEDWDQVSTKELINLFSEANSWNFYSSPIKMQAFIESSLADIVYKYDFNQKLLNSEGTVAQKTAQAEIATLSNNYAATYRRLYSAYITEIMKSFDGWARRLEKIIDWRQKEEFRQSPFANQS